MYNIIAITNRNLCAGDFFERIDMLSKSGIKAIILREKDLSLQQYMDLAARTIQICSKNGCKCILHSYVDAAQRLSHKLIHLPMPLLIKYSADIKDFNLVGASAHSIDEALTAQKLGADYITASHIFETKCKQGLEPKGLDFLKSVCSAVDIPVYALGGIDMSKMPQITKAGAYGGCIMSGLMTCDSASEYLRMNI